MDVHDQCSSGHGGDCSELWGIDVGRHWCTNLSEGSWAEMPVAMTRNESSQALFPSAEFCVIVER